MRGRGNRSGIEEEESGAALLEGPENLGGLWEVAFGAGLFD